METEARLSREAWRRSMDASDLACGEVMSLRTTVLAQMSEIRELHDVDRRRQAMILEMLRADQRRSTEMRELRTKMAPKRATRSTPVTTTPAPTATTTTSVTNAQLQAMIDQGVTAALAARDANRNGDDSHTSGTGALTWWNSHVITVSHDIAYAITWADLRKKITEKYCPWNEMKKLEAELWNLKKMFPEESDKIERYVGGLPDMIHGNIVASKPKTMQETVQMATELMDKKVSTIAERHAENKRKSAGNANHANNQRGTGSGQKSTCFECGVQGHFKRECPKFKNNKNRGNQVGNDRAQQSYAVGSGDMRGKTQTPTS
ncbi:putative reverse transcriptase domain-containing protein [Tanacetum coccineum]|uniref:Reverse transcriptase domain-containing protein n=1 Tax=Tanacetum coccineum TaxID=301880 RepID=A0ABQ5GYT4_9ASTR